MARHTDYVSMTTGEVFTDQRQAVDEWLNGDTVGVYVNGKYTGCSWVHRTRATGRAIAPTLWIPCPVRGVQRVGTLKGKIAKMSDLI